MCRVPISLRLQAQLGEIDPRLLDRRQSYASSYQIKEDTSDTPFSYNSNKIMSTHYKWIYVEITVQFKRIINDKTNKHYKWIYVEITVQFKRIINDKTNKFPCF